MSEILGFCSELMQQRGLVLKIVKCVLPILSDTFCMENHPKQGDG
jgi:hypothetical protein